MKESIKNWLHGQFGDDEAIIGEIYAEYLNSAGEKLAETDAALAAADYPQLDRLAHTFKGNALMVGDQEFADAAYELRNASKISDGPACAAAVAKLHALHDAQTAEG